MGGCLVSAVFYDFCRDGGESEIDLSDRASS
jgi:hypothetical protein